MAQDDYLKYWRVIRYYILRKNNLKPGTVDALMIYFHMGGLKYSQNQRLIPGKRNSKQYTNYLKNQNE